MAGSGTAPTGEKMRLCPACRMSISVLATKCRFCGEPVSRPREETRRLSITDLGGESNAKQVVPSDHVLDALESFRREVIGDSDPGGSPEVPALDLAHQALASAVQAPSTSISRKRAMVARRQAPTWHKPAMIVGAIIVVIVLGFGLKKVLSGHKSQGFVDDGNNPAVSILKSGGPGLDAVRAASTALRSADTPANRVVFDDACEKLKQDAEALLNTNPLDVSRLQEASTLVNQAMAIDSTVPAIQDLKKEVDEDVYAYKLSVAELDPAEGKVILNVVYPDWPSDLVIKKKGESVKGRLKVRNITATYVTFEDPKRKSTGGLPRTFRLSKDGTLVPD